MKKGDETRKRLVETASRLVEAQGYAATGLAQVLKESGAPRGSLYFHFPGGKEQLAGEVVAAHAAHWTLILEQVSRHAVSALEAASMMLALLAARFEATACESGCPVTAIALEMATRSSSLRAAVRAAYESWAAVIAEKLQHEGWSAAQAQSRARVAIAAIEGSLIVGRAFGDAGPLRDLRALLPALLARPSP